MSENIIKQQILKNLLQSIIHPLQEYIDILKEAIIAISNDSEKSTGEFMKLVDAKLTDIKSHSHQCNDLNTLCAIYHKLIEFLSNFEQLDESCYIKFDKLIIKFIFFDQFFQSIKITINIIESLDKDEVNEKIILETKKLLQHNGRLLNILYLESIALNEFIQKNNKLAKLKLNNSYKLKIIQSNQFQKFLIDRKLKLNII